MMEFSSERGDEDWWEKVQNQREHGRFCDVVFHVSSKAFPAHRNILAATSPYFSSIFNAMNVTKEHVTVPCQNPEVMEQLLRFVYLGKATIDQIIVFDLLRLSSTYLLHYLKGCCKDYLQANLNLTNCLTVYEYADRYVLHDLKQLAEDYIKKNITFIVVGSELLKYSFEQIASFLWNKKWNVDDSSKFVSVCHWVNMDPTSYSKYFSQLLSNIWLSQVTVQVLQEVFDVCPMFNDGQMKKAVFDAMAVQTCMPDEFQEEYQKLLEVENDSQNEVNDNTNTSNTLEDKTETTEEEQITNLAMVNVTNVEQSKISDDHNTIEVGVTANEVSDGKCPVLNVQTNTEADEDVNKETDKEMIKDMIETYGDEANDLNEAASSHDDSDPDYQPEIYQEATDKLNVKEEPNAPVKRRTRSSASKLKKARVPVPRVRIKIKDIPKAAGSKRKQSVPMKVRRKPGPKRPVRREDSEIDTDDEDGATSERKRRKLNRKRLLNQSFVCELCCFKTSSEERFKKHEIQAHKDGVVFKCHRCDYESSWNREFYRHMKQHYKGPPYDCEEEDCDYVADRIQFLLLHRMKHTNERPFECTVCNSKFRNKWTLTTHLKIHTGEKPYVCPICNQSFGTKGTMQQHMVSHSDARPYLCDICGFTTKYQSHLTTHKRIHTGNVFRCEVCDYFTPKRNQLQNHMKIHLSIRSFVCSTCGRAFTEKSHMVRHERIHTPDKPFKCDQCNYASNRRDKLKEHISKHHTPGVVSKTPYRPRRQRKTSAVSKAEEPEAAPTVQSQPPEQPVSVPHQPTPVQVYPNNEAAKQAMQPQSLYLGYNTDGMLLTSQIVATADSTVDTSQLLGLTHIGQQGVPVSMTDGQVVDPRLLTHMMAPMQPPRDMNTAPQHTATPPMNPQGQVPNPGIPQQQGVPNPDSVAYITLSKY